MENKFSAVLSNVDHIYYFPVLPVYQVEYGRYIGSVPIGKNLFKVERCSGVILQTLNRSLFTGVSSPTHECEIMDKH